MTFWSLVRVILPFEMVVPPTVEVTRNENLESSTWMDDSHVLHVNHPSTVRSLRNKKSFLRYPNALKSLSSYAKIEMMGFGELG